LSSKYKFLAKAPLTILAFLGEPSSQSHSLPKILDSIVLVESGGVENPPDGAAGEIGPYQILRAYWEDSGVPGEYEMCRGREYAQGVVRAYMERWCPGAWASGNAEVIARTHNGGPRGRHKDSTFPYWKKVEAVLKSKDGLHQVDNH